LSQTAAKWRGALMRAMHAIFRRQALNGNPAPHLAMYC
jgi:hypothetical protein